MNKFSKLFFGIAISVMVGLGVSPIVSNVGAVTGTSGAVGSIEDQCSDPDLADSAVCKSSGDNAGSLIKTVINTLLFITGILSGIMIIIGGVLYTISSGDQANVTKAKNTITYALVGLIVSFAAFAIVNWVFTAFK